MQIYSKKGFLIENNHLTKNHYLQLSRRALAFIMDLLIPGLIQGILFYILGPSFIYWISSSLISIAFVATSFLLIPLIANRTLGMFFAKLYISHKSGFLTNSRDQIKRGVIAIIFYAPPIMREISIIISSFWALITKGFSPLDLLSGTIIIDKYTKLKLERLESREHLQHWEGEK